MSTEIQITAEQLVRESLKRYVVEHADPDQLIAETIRQLYPNSNGETVRAQALANSVAEGIKRMERQAATHESEFRKIGQLSLLGELIPEHCVPHQLMEKSTAEMRDYMANRAEMEKQNADEMRAAAVRQEEKARRFEAWSDVVTKVYRAVVDMGLNPEVVSYAEALSKAEKVNPGRSAGADTSATRPLR